MHADHRAGDTRENTTWDSGELVYHANPSKMLTTVADIERLREHVGVDKWMVFGGSW